MSDAEKKSPMQLGWLFSSVGVLAVAGIAGGFVLISHYLPWKHDFTANKVFSLTEGTRKIVKGVDTPVNIKLFVSDADEMPPELIGRLRDVESLLLQYEDISGKVVFKKTVVKPDSDEEDAALLEGVSPQRAQKGNIFFGISVSCLEKKEVIEFVPQVQDELMEYEVSRAISSVTAAKKKKLGLMSALPVAGGGMPMMGGGGRPWTFYSQISKDYEVKTVEVSATKIDDDIDVLFLLHPAGITDEGQYAVDQFIMKGKPVVAMVDSFSVAAQASQGRQQNPMMQQGGAQTSSSLPKLLSAWGYTYDSTNVLADRSLKTPLRGGKDSPFFLTIGPKNMNTKDVVTSQLGDAMFVLSGGFTGKAADGLTEEKLVFSSRENQMVPSMEAQQGQDEAVLKKFKSSDTERLLAFRLKGKFKTAFPDGKPKKEDKPADPSKPEEKKPEDKKDETPQIKEAEKEGFVLLVADTDFLWDSFSVQVMGNMAMPFNGNFPLGMNLIDQVTGDTNLVQIRSRGSSRRPFTTIKEIEAKANENIKSQVEGLQKEADEANTKIQELQSQKGGDIRAQLTLSPAQKAELKNFEKKKGESMKKVREKQKEARADIDSKLFWIKFWNIASAPLLVALLGFVVVTIKKSRTSAK